MTVIQEILNLFGRKVIGCKGTNCPLKNYCKKHTNFIKDRHTTFYSTVPYNHKKETCTSYKPYKDEAI